VKETSKDLAYRGRMGETMDIPTWMKKAGTYIDSTSLRVERSTSQEPPESNHAEITKQ
jgi:hypothetical protein